VAFGTPPAALNLVARLGMRMLLRRHDPDQIANSAAGAIRASASDPVTTDYCGARGARQIGPKARR
jgi:hypothetical protein